MASSEKTPGLGLSAWRGSDVPQREDFVQDNQILDSAITALQRSGGSGPGGPGNDPRLDAHMADQQVHLSGADRQALSAAAPPVIGSYTGDGHLVRAVILGFRPSFGILFADNRPLVEPSGNGLFQTSLAGILTNTGGTAGLEAQTTGFRAQQAETGNVTGMNYLGMNRDGVRYVYIMWR